MRSVEEKIAAADTRSDMPAAQDTVHLYEWALDIMTDPDGSLWFLEAKTWLLTYGGGFGRATL